VDNKIQCHNLTSTKLITPKHSETQPRITQDIGNILLRWEEVCADHLTSILRTLRGQSVVEKAQRNCEVLFSERFTTLRRSEIHIDIKIDADALYRRQRRFCLRRTVSMKGYGGRILDTEDACRTHKK
jgi:hypothetical protein